MDSLPVTSSEAFVLQICERSFLSMWCYNNPQHTKSKELCDILVVCDPHIIIISVKECELDAEADVLVAHNRWRKRAIEKSIKQIFTADGRLKGKTYVTRKDGSRGIDLPDPANRRIHRLAVAFGSRGEIPISSHQTKKGYVHVMTDNCFRDILTELDTITDLVGYLVAKEEMGYAVFVKDGTEAEILAWYLMNDRTFPKDDLTCVMLDGTLWPALRDRDDYKRKKAADRISYGWDKLIESMNNPSLFTLDGQSISTTEAEPALRIMAKEPRSYRRLLSDGIADFLEKAFERGSGYRIIGSDRGVIYVIAFLPPDKSFDQKCAALNNVCFIARHVVGKGEHVIGIGFTPHGPEDGFTNTLAYFEPGEWTQQKAEDAAALQEKLGIFKGPSRQVAVDEYPFA